MKDEFIKRLLKYPERLDPKIQLTSHNAQVPIHNGMLYIILKSGEKVETVGEVFFDWFPRQIIKVKCELSEVGNNFFKDQFPVIGSESDLEIPGYQANKIRITDYRHSTNSPDIVKGRLSNSLLRINKGINPNKVSFEIPNFRDFFGEVTRTESGTFSSRLSLDGRYLIIIDQLPTIKESNKILKDKGGFLLTHTGTIEKVDGNPFPLQEIEEILKSLRVFLSFINGRRTSPLFLKGFQNAEFVSEIMEQKIVDPYIQVHTWLPNVVRLELSGIWQNFQKFWANENDRDVLNTAIHWYIEGNKQSGYVDGAIALCQNGLELLFNYIAVETRKEFSMNKARSFNAAEKIGYLIKLININSEVPTGLKHLHNYSVDSDLDAPGLFTDIRNKIVHSTNSKRKKLKEIDLLTKYEALQLGLWYTELLILFLLDYKGKYSNRCSSEGWNGDEVEVVPWANLSRAGS